MAEPPTLGLLTSGGDAPGMNTALWALCRGAEAHGWRVLGVREGFTGLLAARAEELAADTTLGWARYGGTRLGTSRLSGFRDHLPALRAALDTLGVDRLVVLGGNGSLAAAGLLAEGHDVIGIPATIDNDVADSDESIGFDTALNSGLALLDAIRDSAEALPRLFALETLGGDTGFLAQAVGEAGGADVLLVPERPLDPAALRARVTAAIERRNYAVVVASEGYPELERVLDGLAASVGLRIRFSRIGHAQRGGRPSGRDRLLATAFAAAAIDALAAGRSGRLVWRGGRTELLPYGAAAKPFVADRG